jgi:hypothetical protein
MTGAGVFARCARHLRNKAASPKGGRLIRSSAAIDVRPVMVPVTIAVVIFSDDDSVPIPVLVAITDNPAVMIPVAVPIMPGADGYANRPDTDSNFFRARRHCRTNARNSGNHQSVFHYVLQYCEIKVIEQDASRSLVPTD